MSSDTSKQQEILAALKRVTESLEELQKTCETLDQSYTKFHSQQTQCAGELKRQKKQLKRLREQYPGEQKVIEVTQESLETVKTIQRSLPKPNNFYLSLIVGSRLSVVLPGQNARLEYKHHYEGFKLKINGIMLAISAFLLYVHVTFHDTDAEISTLFRTCVRCNCFFFLWYYCTLTVRESILIVNGSKIKGWYMAHHYLSIILSGIIVTIPDGTCNYFVVQYLCYTVYNNFVSLLQFSYQKSALYGLRALGKRETDMDITTDTGLTGIMANFVSLKVLLPFLLMGYAYQGTIGAYMWNFYWKSEDQPWQVLAISVLFIILFLGNIITMSKVLRKKFSKSKTQ